jgi:hypothetical protein
LFCFAWITPVFWLQQRREAWFLSQDVCLDSGDNGFHVIGALVVAPERALQHSIEQLKRIVDEFAEFVLFIISPVTTYVSNPCCTNTSHVTNFREPDFLSNLISDLTKLKFQLRKKLQPAVIIDGI